MFLLNASYFPSASPASVQFGFPTFIVVSLFVFPYLSVIVPVEITICVTPSLFSKFPNVNSYTTF